MGSRRPWLVADRVARRGHSGRFGSGGCSSNSSACWARRLPSRPGSGCWMWPAGSSSSSTSRRSSTTSWSGSGRTRSCARSTVATVHLRPDRRRSRDDRPVDGAARHRSAAGAGAACGRRSRLCSWPDGPARWSSVSSRERRRSSVPATTCAACSPAVTRPRRFARSAPRQPSRPARRPLRDFLAALRRHVRTPQLYSLGVVAATTRRAVAVPGAARLVPGHRPDHGRRRRRGRVGHPAAELRAGRDVPVRRRSAGVVGVPRRPRPVPRPGGAGCAADGGGPERSTVGDRARERLLHLPRRGTGRRCAT